MPTLNPNAYPYLLPHLYMEADGAYLGSLKYSALSEAALAFCKVCDGRTPFQEITMLGRGYEELGAAAEYVVWLDQPLNAFAQPPAQSEMHLILSPHPHVGLLSMGGFLLHRRGAIDCRQVVCFSTVNSTINPVAFTNVAEVSAIRRDEVAICADIAGCRTEDFELPIYELRKLTNEAVFLRNEDHFRNLLKLDLYRLIAEKKPAHVYAPSGMGNHPDHKMLFEIVLDFFKQNYFAETEFHLYEDFPFSSSYLNVDDFLSGFEGAYAEVEAWHEDVSDVVEAKCQLLDIFKSLFSDEDKQRLRQVAKRNVLFAGNGVSGGQIGGVERFWRLKDLVVKRGNLSNGLCPAPR